MKFHKRGCAFGRHPPLRITEVRKENGVGLRGGEAYRQKFVALRKTQ